MEKPQLTNFELTEQNLAAYERQLINYETAKREQYIADNEYNKRIKRNAIIASITAFVIFAIVTFIEMTSNEGEPPVFGIIILVLSMIAPIAFTVKSEGTKGILSGLFIALFPFIGLGCAIVACYEKKGTNIEKSRYIDSANEQKVQNYKMALEKYKNCTDKSRPAYWQGLSPYEFEKEVANLYALLGYSTKVTKSTGDGGVDIILTKDGEKIGVQCKHHAKPIGPDPVRSLIGVVASQGFDFGIFVSLNGFTATVRTEFANSRVRVQMVSCSELCDLARSA